jgi:superfamily II DNA or RNA helicase
LEVLPREEHLGQHQPGYVAFGEGVLVPSRVVSIEPYGQEETYDVVCADPHHNFAANGVIVHNCGKGKTILALMYAAWRGWKTLVIVDTDFIIDQWVSAMQKLFLLRASRVGLVKQKVCRIGAHFTIASAKTLAKRGKDPEFYDQFGLVIFDEVHVASAPTFKGILSQVKGERLGLTATPDRKDGMDSLFKYHLGGLEPCYVDTSREMPCTWYFKETEPTVRKELLDKDLLKRAAEEAEKEKSRKSGYKAQARYQELAKIHCYRKIPRLGKYALQRARFENYAYADEKWFETICSDISRAAGAGRNILVLGGRVEHLGQLTDTLQAHGISAGLAVGEVKGADRLKAFKKQVVLATWQLAYKALDIERLDTLILLFPTSDANFLRQASGRIDDRARTGKKNPVVITYCHGYVPSLDRLTAEMLALLPDIDPSAIIRSVRKGTKK